MRYTMETHRKNLAMHMLLGWIGYAKQVEKIIEQAKDDQRFGKPGTEEYDNQLKATTEYVKSEAKYSLTARVFKTHDYQEFLNRLNLYFLMTHSWRRVWSM
jgi:hypothetical protein